MGLSYYFRERAGAHPCRDRPYGRRSLSLTELWSVRFNKRTHRSSAYAQTIKKATPFGVVFLWWARRDSNSGPAD